MTGVDVLTKVTQEEMLGRQANVEMKRKMVFFIFYSMVLCVLVEIMKFRACSNGVKRFMLNDNILENILLPVFYFTLVVQHLFFLLDCFRRTQASCR